MGSDESKAAGVTDHGTYVSSGCHARASSTVVESERDRWIFLDADAMVHVQRQDSTRSASDHIRLITERLMVDTARVRRVFCRHDWETSVDNLEPLWLMAGWSVHRHISSSVVPALRREFLTLLLSSEEPNTISSQGSRDLVVVVGDLSDAVTLSDDLEELLRLGWKLEILFARADGGVLSTVSSLFSEHIEHVSIRSLVHNTAIHETLEEESSRDFADSALPDSDESASDSLTGGAVPSPTAHSIPLSRATSISSAEESPEAMRRHVQHLDAGGTRSSACNPDNRERFVFMNADSVLFGLRRSKHLHPQFGDSYTVKDLRVNFARLTRRACNSELGRKSALVRKLKALYSFGMPTLSMALTSAGWTAEKEKKQALEAAFNNALLELLESYPSVNDVSVDRTLVLVVGDCTPIRGIVAQFLARGWAVEIHSWSHTLRESVLQQMEDKPEQVLVRPLDDDDVRDLLFVQPFEASSSDVVPHNADRKPEHAKPHHSNASNSHVNSGASTVKTSDELVGLRDRMSLLEMQLRDARLQEFALRQQIDMMHATHARTVDKLSRDKWSMLGECLKPLVCPVSGDIMTDSVLLLCCGRSVASKSVLSHLGCPLCGAENLETRRNESLNEIAAVVVVQSSDLEDANPSSRTVERGESTSTERASSSASSVDKNAETNAPDLANAKDSANAPTKTSEMPKNWRCSPCNIDFISSSALVSHQNHHLPCPSAGCGYSASKRLVKVHVAERHPGLDEALIVYPNGSTCKLCRANFRTRVEFDSHVESLHPSHKKNTATASAEQQVKSQPPTKANSVPQSRCAPCARDFGSATALEQHQLTHVACPVRTCNFSALQAIVEHHTKKRHSKCVVCGRWFLHAMACAQHVRDTPTCRKKPATTDLKH